MDEEIGVNGPDMTWEEFQAQAYHENFEGGVYIVNGDEPILNEKLLREFYDFLYTDNGLIVNRVGGTDDRWNDTAKLNLTFCVSNTFGGNKNAVVSAMNAATGNWEAAANVNFVYHSEFDASCTASQSGVVFDIRPVSGQSYLARSFFPSNGRSSRNVLIDSTAFNTSWTLTNILTHELGHTLGFRHEHTRPEAGTCFEDNNWRVLTTYDSASTMHYPQCNGTGNTLQMTTRDRQGAASLYGAPGGGNPPPPPPPGCTPQSGSASGSVAVNQQVNYSPLSVSAGSNFRVVMTGSGDPDLYVRFGATPTTTQFNCRPFLNGASETCNLTVPAGQSQAFISIRGFTAATYSINVNWCQP
ncbi:MAG TPA: M57 family metalloprotease [Kofleriaceae bacterium]|nr:M57 family metalloprotease [Kofleriaceae bacterium]